MSNNYSIKFIKESEQASYYVNDSKDANKPNGWKSIKKYENSKTGFKAEAFVTRDGQKVLVFAGTDPLSRDLLSDLQILKLKQVPIQANDAFNAYMKFKSRYNENEKIIVVGYSLGGALSQIVCNETGASGITFAPLGVNDIVQPEHTSQIINIGNENDPFYRLTFDQQLGKRYLIPDDSTDLNSGISVFKHLPNKIGDISKAVKQEERYQHALDNSYILDGYVNKNIYNDSIFDSSNKVMYNDDKKLEEMSEEEIKRMVEQYFDNGDRLPEKEEMDRRVRFGELIYV